MTKMLSVAVLSGLLAVTSGAFGRYEVDEATRTFTFHVEGALVRSLVGEGLRRSFEFELSGRQLIVRSQDPNERWRVAWERY